jgi:hypothetical protein
MSRGRTRGPALSFFAFQDIITSVVGIVVLITLIMIIDLISKSKIAEEAQPVAVTDSSEIIGKLQSGNAALQRKLDSLMELNAMNKTQAVLAPEEYKNNLRAKSDAIQSEVEKLAASNAEMQRELKATEQDRNRLESERNLQEEKKRELDSIAEKVASLERKRKILLTDESLRFRKTDLDGRSIVIIDMHPNEFRILDVESSKRTVLKNQKSNNSLQDWILRKPLATMHFVILIRPDAADAFGPLRDFLDGRGASFGFDVIEAGKTIRLADETEDQME